MFTYGQWTATSLSTRNKIALAFNIEKKGYVEVVGNQIKHDGYAIADIEKALTPGSLKLFLNTDENDPQALWGMMINKIEGREPILPTPTLVVNLPSETITSTEILEPLDTPIDRSFEGSAITPPVPTLKDLKVEAPLAALNVEPRKNKGGRPKGSLNRPK